MNYGVIDIESIGWNKFYLIGLYYDDTFLYFRSLKSFFNEIENKKYKGVRWYAHNGGRFDFLFLIEEIKRRKYIIDYISSGSSIIAMNCKGEYFDGKNIRTRKIEFVDSWHLLQDSLFNLGNSFNVSVKKGEIDYGKIGIKKYDKEVIEYLALDCISLYQIIGKAIKFFNVNKLKMTIASQAMSTFTNDFRADFQIELMSNEQDYEFRKNYYSGGRVELYKHHGKNLHYYDVNSLYPFVMLKPMPIGNMISTNTFNENKIGFYKVEIEDISSDLPFGKFLYKLNEKNITENYYINGSGTYYLSSAEILYLLEKKYINIKNIIEGVYCSGISYDFFKEYVNYFYNEKKNATGARRYLSKLMMNGLYGKLAEKRERQRIVDIDTIDVINDNFFSDNSYYAIVNEISEPKKYYGLFMGSYITNLARLELLKLFVYITNKGKDIYYCDTDSVITDCKIHTGNEIGELKNEMEIDEGIFLFPKFYALKNTTNEKIVCKGFQKDKFTFQNFKNYLKGNDEFIENREKMLTFRAAMRRKSKIVSSEGTFLKVVEAKKGLKNKQYDKRIWTSENNSRPYLLSELKEKNQCELIFPN